MEIRPVSSREILDASNAALLTEYDAECSIPEIGKACPQVEQYAAMEETGRFRCFGVFSGEELAGFASVLVYVVPHYGRRIATVESLFVAKAHRSGRTGSGLMRAIEEHAREEKCCAVLYSAPANSQLERLLGLLKDYRRSNSVFVRAL